MNDKRSVQSDDPLAVEQDKGRSTSGPFGREIEGNTKNLDDKKMANKSTLSDNR